VYHSASDAVNQSVTREVFCRRSLKSSGPAGVQEPTSRLRAPRLSLQDLLKLMRMRPTHTADRYDLGDSRRLLTFCVLIINLSLFTNAPLFAVCSPSGSRGVAEAPGVEVVSSRVHAPATVAIRAQRSTKAQTHLKHLPVYFSAFLRERAVDPLITLWRYSPIRPGPRSFLFASRPLGRAPPSLA